MTAPGNGSPAGLLGGKAAIITGSATGIGKAIAQAFAAHGAAVVIDWVGSEGDAPSVVDSIARAGGRAIQVEADVTKEVDWDRLVGRAVDVFGRLDILVNNAGVEHKMPFLNTPLEVWSQVIAVDLTGPWLGAQRAAQRMAEQGGGGRIINISSIHEDLPMPTNSPYCAAKGGLRMMMRTLALELAPFGITVNNIGPGAIDTAMDAGIEADPAAFAALKAEIPLGRMGRPEEVAAVAAFLASDQAAYVTGSTYFVDGGMMRFAGTL